MLRLILFLFFLVASVWIGIEILRHPGYLLVVYQPWMVEMPLWFALLSFIVFLLLFYLLIDSIDKIQLAWFRFKNWLRFRREHQFFSNTQHGFIALIEGQWRRAEKFLLAGANRALEPLINYLGAAKAAHEQGAFERRDQYMQKAYQIAPKASLAIGLTQAQLELEQNQLEHAAATLDHLRQSSPRHPEVLKLLEKTYVKLADWQNLLGLLPSLRKTKILTSEELALFEKNVYSEILRHAEPQDLASLHNIWNDIPRSVRKNSDVIVEYVKLLQRFDNTNSEIEELIQKTLKYQWQPELVKIYGSLPLTNLNRQLVIVGAWLKMYGQKPELLLLLGKICVQVQLWGKAKDYFEKCLALGPNPEAALEYGKLLEHLDDHDAAMEKYREGLAQCTLYMNTLNDNKQ